MQPDLRPLITRLALETSHPDILDDMVRYQSAAVRWEVAGFPVRDPDELAFILGTVCPGCRHDVNKTCTCCGAKGQRVAVKAWMDTEICPAMRW